jgi:23S rRNA G2445 N2-methylase RlmL
MEIMGKHGKVNMETRVSHKCIEVGKTLYQALSVGTPRFSSRAAYYMLHEVFRASSGKVRLYDPFCGNGVLLVTAFLLFPDRVKGLAGSDLDPAAVETARRNMRWLRDAEAFGERLETIQAYKTRDQGLKDLFSQRCRRMYNKAQGIDLKVEVFEQDACSVGEILAAVDDEVWVAADPPYGGEQWVGGQDGYGPLEPFLRQVAAATNVPALVLCYPLEQSVMPLLQRYFSVSVARGTKGRNIYVCRRQGKREGVAVAG